MKPLLIVEKWTDVPARLVSRQPERKKQRRHFTGNPPSDQPGQYSDLRITLSNSLG
ncbi:hypothetical protein [Marinobacter xestospongiae]|uniref:hypothetical protein n=1 Tax=Marinobacter xestospongiae TaxID=994319 RepID=UPI0020069F06|nr:hypothetical protein [Marinobacter xestospongiae]MCK7567688.1 hypothetical protein [Marinobacter xestospongiae]